ncbi:MAG: cupin domain-containing protein [Pseudomonadota bacterium]
MKILKLEDDWQSDKTLGGDPWRYRDLSGERLGVRVEELAPGATSSEHHYHTVEEEHVIILEGEGTLFFGEEAHPITAGEHCWFRAAEEIAHHIENTSGAPLKLLVFGERSENDVVVYPNHQVMMVKSLDRKQYTYRPLGHQ